MNEGRQAALGVLVALLSGVIILGSAMLALTEVGYELAAAPDLTATYEMETMPTMVFVLPGSLVTSSATAVLFTVTPTPTFTPPSTCDYPPGWVPIIVGVGETFGSLARKYGISRELLKSGNCMQGSTLEPRSVLYVPDTPATVQTCGAPPGWVKYTVRKGDTLTNIGQRTGVTAADLRWANCMGSSDLIIIGQSLWVPFWPPPLSTATPVPMFTFVPTITPSPTWPFPSTSTPTWPFPSTFTPTWPPVGNTHTPTPTHTGTLIAPATATPTPTNTAILTLPVFSTPTATSTLANTATHTATQLPPMSTTTATQPPPANTTTPTTGIVIATSLPSSPTATLVQVQSTTSPVPSVPTEPSASSQESSALFLLPLLLLIMGIGYSSARRSRQ